MPMKSKAQRGFLHANNPKVASEFEKATPKGKKLPKFVGKMKGKGKAKGKKPKRKFPPFVGKGKPGSKPKGKKPMPGGM